MPRHWVLDDNARIDRAAVCRRARFEWEMALARGDEGPARSPGYWMTFIWRSARGQRDRAAFKRLEAEARRVMEEEALRRL